MAGLSLMDKKRAQAFVTVELVQALAFTLQHFIPLHLVLAQA